MENIIVEIKNMEQFEKLERAYYEVNSRSNIIAYLLSNNQTGTDLFNQYHNDYVAKFIEYETLKSQVHNDYNMNQYGDKATWTADFTNKQFVISYHD